ncbi:YceD family protein [Yoonia sp.]|uniref:YceD family protein n=1 Tax=Yoonia sp. TaxID=2212373 RepID=UPI003974A53E
MPQLPKSHLRLADLATRKPTDFELVPTPDERKAIAAELGILGIKKLRFAGALTPQGRQDWTLTADLGATVVQECVVTLEPVTTRIDAKLTRSYVADMPEIEAAEVEMPVEDTVEELPETLDLAQVMIEALALELPLYPRAEGAALPDAVFTEPGIAPMTDDEAKPFAGLGALRDRLEKKDK